MAYQKSNWTNNDTGILRKKKENNLEELLVFGYSCKLFKDDERALQIDQGKHLIPCMSDETLQIDRYDVRGALADLSIYEANSANSSDYWGGLTNEERHIEQLCDKERYRALTHNEDEEALYQEEELKRLHQALGSDKTYGQVSYSYDNENGNSIDKPVEESNQNEDPDETFVPPNELDIPPGMVIPETVKLNAIIEKTAMFINQQGMQMEIILKMKQSGNPQFEFLSYKSSLHNYYRHLLMALKTGRYKPKPQVNSTEKSQPQNEESISEQSSYLHHSLSQAPSFNLTPLIPNINYKPSSDCAYSMLVNKIKGNQNKFNDSTKINSVILSETVVNENKSSETLSSSPKMYSQGLVTYDKNDEANDPFKPSSPSSVGQRPSRRRRHKRQQGAFAYNDTYDEETVDVPMLVDDSDIQQNDEKVQIVLEPPYDIQLIIDKMASYVAKNGRNFEEIVKCKNDPRFNFLETTNEFYPYYNKKVEECEKNYKNDSCEDSNTGENAENSNRSLQGTLKPNPVCFSIKKPKETECLEIKSALPLEESTDEENPENESNNRENNENINQNISKGSELYDPLDIMEEVDESMKEDRKSANNSLISSEKKNEERIKDKLTAAAKESLAMKDRDKQLQLERKRRAAAFLNLIQKNKKSTSAEINESVLIGPQLPDHLNTEESIGFDNNGEDKQETNDANSNAVSSPPSSVTSPEASVIDEPKLTDKKIDISEISLLNKAIEVIDPSTLSASILLTKIKSSKRPKKDKYEHKSRYSTEYRHKHKKRKRSSSPSRYRRSKTSKPSAYASSNIIVSSRESKRHKHRKHRDSDKYYSEKTRDYISSSRRKHKHYKSKKHKKKEKKQSSGESSGSSDSSETE